MNYKQVYNDASTRAVVKRLEAEYASTSADAEVAIYAAFRADAEACAAFRVYARSCGVTDPPRIAWEPEPWWGE